MRASANAVLWWSVSLVASAGGLAGTFVACQGASPADPPADVSGDWEVRRRVESGGLAGCAYQEEMRIEQAEDTLVATLNKSFAGSGRLDGDRASLRVALADTTLSLDGILVGESLGGTWFDGNGSSGSWTAERVGSQPPPNSEHRYICSVFQGFNFKAAMQLQTGFIEYLKIGDRVISADLTVRDPENPRQDKRVVGVVSDMAWQGGYADPLHFACNVSVVSRQVLLELGNTVTDATQVEVAFAIYDYDSTANVYFRTFHANGERLRGTVWKSGETLAYVVADDQSSEVQSPINYRFGLGILPPAVAQQFFVAAPGTETTILQWGKPL